jgi:hypothetical protein
VEWPDAKNTRDDRRSQGKRCGAKQELIDQALRRLGDRVLISNNPGADAEARGFEDRG